MKRLSTDEVIAAFEKTGRIPRRGSYRGLVHPTACAVGAVALAEKECENALDIFQTFVHELGYGLDYHDGFVSGFDAREPIDDAFPLNARVREGYEDGRAAWNAVQHLIPEGWS